MEVILLERIEKLGQMGDVVNVKAGYARNYLLPQNKALRKNKQNIAHFDSRKAQLEAENLAKRSEAEMVSGKVEGLSVPIVRAAGESGQLYGSVTARDIAAAVSEAGVTINRNQVVLNRALKSLGLEPVQISLHPEVSVEITVNIARSLEEADQQALLGRAVGTGDEFDDDDDEDDNNNQAQAQALFTPPVEAAAEAETAEVTDGAEEEAAAS